MKAVPLILVTLLLLVATDVRAVEPPEETGSPPPLVGLCLEVDPCIDRGPAPCRIWEWYDTNPQVSVNPVLGLIVMDPDGCIRQKVKTVQEFVLDRVPSS